MNLSLKIFSAFGIPVRLHITMLIIPVFVYGLDFGPVSTTTAMAVALALSVLLFGSVLAHEFGHALMARRYGVHTADIVLTPLGGMARMQSIPEKAGPEIFIALAGPLVSFAIALLSFSVMRQGVVTIPGIAAAIAQILFQLNLMLGLFNLVPALPMDGGRVLRGLLALKRDYLSATRIAVRIGRFIAVAGLVYAIYSGSWNLGFIALFVYFGAGTEERIAWMREASKRAQGAPEPGSPFGGHVYTWRWTSAGRGPAAPEEPAEWREPAPPRENGNVVVIQGGKAEVISRKDPEEKA